MQDFAMADIKIDHDQIGDCSGWWLVAGGWWLLAREAG